MHLIALTYRTSQLHLAHLKHAQTTYIHLHLGKIISYNIPYNGVFNISCNLLNTELKVKKRNVCVGTECLQVYWLFTLMITWLTGSCARTTAQHPKRGPSCVSLAQEKIQIQNYKYAFYWMCPAFTPPRSQKVMTLNHCRLGAVCTLLLSNVEKDIL